MIALLFKLFMTIMPSKMSEKIGKIIFYAIITLVTGLSLFFTVHHLYHNHVERIKNEVKAIYEPQIKSLNEQIIVKDTKIKELNDSIKTLETIQENTNVIINETKQAVNNNNISSNKRQVSVIKQAVQIEQDSSITDSVKEEEVIKLLINDLNKQHDDLILGKPITSEINVSDDLYINTIKDIVNV